MIKIFYYVFLAIVYNLATPVAFAQSSDSDCDKWFTYEGSGVCMTTATGVTCQNFSRGLVFPPDCKKNTDKVKDYLKSIYLKVDKWSGIFNRAFKSELSEFVIDFYKASEHSKNMYVNALKERRWNDAAFIIVNSIYFGGLMDVGRSADQFYQALREGRYFDAIKIASTQTLMQIKDKKMPEFMQKFLDGVSHGEVGGKVILKVVNKMAQEYVKTDKRNLNVNYAPDRRFYGAMKTRDFGRAARVAGNTMLKGVGGGSRYYMAPLITPSFSSVDRFSSSPSPLRRHSLQYEPIYEEIAVEGQAGRFGDSFLDGLSDQEIIQLMGLF